ncbi:ABC transporter substrate-binding protein [Holdemania massiliensis]|uniref:ABC transporter substrate-binding protein n=1 Tax=Holdemania massiliensis TaxID=1468449 RepID=UPI001F069803|nr:ABC transporter substrate-binding protein [Holdemania massiliensis]MCH1941817.1 ABC transporter substrate-binding protein [Holdemania massiliensis]
MMLKRKTIIGLLVLFLINTGCVSNIPQNIHQSVITLNWYYMIGDYSIKERNEEINDYLLKSNSGYQINFVSLVDVIPYDLESENLSYTSMSTRLLEYLKKARDDHQNIDIINVNQLGNMDFSRTYLVDEGLLTDLDAYFVNTEAGKIVYNAYPEIVFESQKIEGKSYFIPGSLFDLIETKQSCFDRVAYMALDHSFFQQESSIKDNYSLSQYQERLQEIGDTKQDQLLFYNPFIMMYNFPYLTPVCGNSLQVSPYIIDEKTQTVKIIYECEEWMDSLNTFQSLYQNGYYVFDPSFEDTNAVIWYDYVVGSQENSRITVEENFEFLNVIPYWGLAIPSWCDRKDEVMNFFGLLYSDPELSRVFFPDGVKPGEKMFFGTGNPYIVKNSSLPQDLTKENHQAFYESLNKSCAFGFTFDFSDYFDEMQDLVVKHNEYFTAYNAPQFVDMDLYKEVMKGTRIEEIRNDLNAQLQRYLNKE